MHERTMVTLGLAGFCGIGCLAAIFPAVNLVMSILVGAVAAAALIGVITLLVLLVELHRPVRITMQESIARQRIPSGSP